MPTSTPLNGLVPGTMLVAPAFWLAKDSSCPALSQLKRPLSPITTSLPMLGTAKAEKGIAGSLT